MHVKSEKKRSSILIFFHDFGAFSKNHLSHVSGFCVASHINMYTCILYIYIYIIIYV